MTCHDYYSDTYVTKDIVKPNIINESKSEESLEEFIIKPFRKYRIRPSKWKFGIHTIFYLLGTVIIAVCRIENP